MQDEVFSYESPLGRITYAWNGESCRELRLQGDPDSGLSGDDPVSAWLTAYFSGETCPLPPMAKARTTFQGAMRAALLDIPRGETRTYGELANLLHTAPRAMGQALGANPLPLLIPCHRIVAANGLGGFACGLEWKRRLLAFERSGKDESGGLF